MTTSKKIFLDFILLIIIYRHNILTFQLENEKQCRFEHISIGNVLKTALFFLFQVGKLKFYACTYIVTSEFQARQSQPRTLVIFLEYLLFSKILFHTSEFHHLPRVGPKQLCALAQLGCTREVGTSQYTVKCMFLIMRM